MASSRLVALLLSLAVVSPAAGAQQGSTVTPAPVFSLGQPPRYQFHGSGAAAFSRGGDPAGVVTGTVRRHFLNPVVGLVAGEAEAYGQAGGPFEGAGVRALFSAPALALAAGVDWHVTESRVDYVLSYRTAVRRGGLLGHGTMLRVDWLPTRGRSISVGIQAPLNMAFAGQTRARDTHAGFARSAGARPLPPARAAGPLPAAFLVDASALAAAAHGIRIYSNLYKEDASAELRRLGSWSEASSSYHRQLAAFLARAAGSPGDGEPLAARARAGLLEHVLLPYNRLFGQPKEERGIESLTRDAHASFARWLRDSSAVTPAEHGSVLAAHGAWLEIVEQVHATLVHQWGDDRTVWLPLHLGLHPDEFDEQAEIDSLLARAVERPFTDRNALTLLRSGDLPYEIARSIYLARDYHVLWVHDFAGIREENGETDLIGYEMVADAYLPALTEAVRRYDDVGRLPALMVFVDQFFYEPRNGRLWMSILENPMEAEIDLPGDQAAREQHLRRRQAELRAAVAASRRLQAEARSRGRDWLRDLVKVHVSVTNPSDFSFRSHRIVPPIPFVPDNVIRDHRKIAFFDLTEANPYGGALFLTGIGIGEHYATETWEDRGFRVRGPAALEGRAALRRMLRQQGFRDGRIPPALREVTDVADAEASMANGDYIGRALQVHNEVGFGAKHSSVTRAMLYDLALPGSVVIVPDPIWVSAEWAGMLAGAAARGARVHVIAPAAANAPSPQAPLLAMSHDVVSRLVALRGVLAAHPGSGVMRVGLFAAQAQANDAAGRRREVREGLARAPWIREVIPFDDRTLSVLTQAEAVVAVNSGAPTVARDARQRPPQLHQKTQLIARPGAVAALVRQPGWEDAISDALIAQQRQTSRFAELLGTASMEPEASAMRSSDALLLGYEQSLSEAERKRVSFYFTAGTQNQDPRGLMLDGEATLIVSGIPAAAGLADLFFVMARTTWVEDQPAIDALLPPPGGIMRRIGRLIRPVL